MAKYPDAIIVDDLEQKIRNVYRRDMQDYCSAKECEHFRIGRWRGRSHIDSICLAPDSCDDCLKALEASRKREKEEKDASAAAEIEQLVGRKLNGMVFAGADKSVMVYIAGAILSGFEDYRHHDDLVSYLNRVAGRLPEDWKDGLPCNADVWPHLLPVLEGLSENQLARIIFEWPALALGMETAGGMVEWFLKGVPYDCPNLTWQEKKPDLSESEPDPVSSDDMPRSSGDGEPSAESDADEEPEIPDKEDLEPDLSLEATLDRVLAEQNTLEAAGLLPVKPKKSYAGSSKEISLPTFAKRAGLTAATVRIMCGKGEIKSRPSYKHRIIPESELDKVLAGQDAGTKAT